MTIRKKLIYLENKKIISRKPSAGFVFLIAIIYFFVWFFTASIIIGLLTIFVILFAIIHIIIVRMLEKKNS